MNLTHDVIVGEINTAGRNLAKVEPKFKKAEMSMRFQERYLNDKHFFVGEVETTGCTKVLETRMIEQISLSFWKQDGFFVCAGAPKSRQVLVFGNEFPEELTNVLNAVKDEFEGCYAFLSDNTNATHDYGQLLRAIETVERLVATSHEFGTKISTGENIELDYVNLVLEWRKLDALLRFVARGMDNLSLTTNTSPDGTRFGSLVEFIR